EVGGVGGVLAQGDGGAAEAGVVGDAQARPRRVRDGPRRGQGQRQGAVDAGQVGARVLADGDGPCGGEGQTAEVGGVGGGLAQGDAGAAEVGGAGEAR